MPKRKFSEEDLSSEEEFKESSISEEDEEVIEEEEVRTEEVSSPKAVAQRRSKKNQKALLMQSQPKPTLKPEQPNPSSSHLNPNPPDASRNSCPPQMLLITQQEGLVQDSYNKNGRAGIFHVVAKNVPFHLHVTSLLDLILHPISAELVYEEDNSAVLSPQPLQWATVVKPGSKNFEAIVTVRVLVLSSQHQGSLFRVHLKCGEGSAFSEPIRVISKRSQAQKILVRQQQHVQSVLSSAGQPPLKKHKLHPRKESEEVSSPASSLPSSPPLQETQQSKQSQPQPPQAVQLPESLMKMLHNLEEQQKQQSLLLQRLVSERHVPAGTPTSSPIETSQVVVGEKTQKVAETKEQPKNSDLESSFASFLMACAKTPREERLAKLRKLLRSAQSEHASVLSDLAAVIWYSQNEAEEHANPQTTNTDFNNSLLLFSNNNGNFNVMSNNSNNGVTNTAYNNSNNQLTLSTNGLNQSDFLMKQLRNSQTGEFLDLNNMWLDVDQNPSSDL